MSKESKLILLSSGGTGGHVFPAIALGRDLLSRGYRVEMATDVRGTRYEAEKYGIKVHVLKSGTLGSGLLGKIKGATSLGLGVLQARKLVDRLKPSVVVGFGGYPSFPAVFAAQQKRIPTVIHEQNAIIGRANILLAPKADRIALSMSRVEGLEEVDAVRAIVTGNPVRDDIADLYNKPYPTLETDGVLNVFVMGGSQGAQIFSDVMPEALAQMPAPYKKRLRIVQQCRPDDIDRTRAIYNTADIQARLSSFFDDVPDILTQTHLIIGRSGASTVAEVTASGRPAIFVPYPHHADQQQKINAETVVDAGGAWIMDQKGFTNEALITRLETFMQNPETLFRAAEASRSCGKPDAARRLGNLVTALASGWDKKEKTRFDPTQGHG
ncbi:MAG: undecaprenyldiphospho-muramoylpentapeptide beta-N-acetylglucosaminyltransferase [Alphaproteobacteria bacterium]|jgi:UDP-N-acetylglucosamine--N-acetylmuramyl-(pentapeptide) pyrophosphoryl-undecaprenol N-acetylglucosamine transferase|nr:undecaprenyldiphospho-muramoylpentapeptide beta-N-acetylglucosaminyltransferase [Alphaproteobacteria bacterium]MDP7223196.1 undecaprenyldiphospho-muramoylpentapeptide beta-N-acetylglucosaminyltransferase [Alphaproteobacteria bacterium]